MLTAEVWFVGIGIFLVGVFCGIWGEHRARKYFMQRGDEGEVGREQ